MYALTIALSSFLLFAVQPAIAKMILPWFGGSSSVWSTCMLFFQAALLLGYLYAHWLNEKLPPRRQALVHTAALAVSLAWLPILPNPSWKTAAIQQPSLRILALLSVTVGLPYFLLSSTSPLLQAWYARTHKSGMPYRLFALSNFASLLALLSYPFLVEPNLPVRMQGLGWSGAYVCFAAVCAFAAWNASRGGETAAALPLDDMPRLPAPNEPLLLWLGLAAAASVLLLAVSAHVTQDVAAIPFLWILPLSAYLLSFILCFEMPWLYRRALFLPLTAVALGFMAYQISPYRESMGVGSLISFFAGGLFVCSMACHGELARLKPHPRRLTVFYLTVSAGGALGGIFVGLLAPNLFRAYYELPLGLALCAAMIFLVLRREPWRLPRLSRREAMALLTVILCGYFVFLAIAMRDMTAAYRISARNFYGQLRVRDAGDVREGEYPYRVLSHGVINHGEQVLDEGYRRSPITYFCPESGVGRAMRALEGSPRRIGILGLGCGTLAAYGRRGDTIRIYEINPLVVELSQKEFTYLSDTSARVELALGDGRLVLESEPGQQFDLLVMDAFSSDSVPVHLITLEAFRTYFRHLKPNGILAVNISNMYLDLSPVMQAAANALGKTALFHDFTPDNEDFLCYKCRWALVMNAATAAAHPELLKAAETPYPRRGFRVWTDDFSNLFTIMK